MRGRRGETVGGPSKEAAVCEPRRETTSADALILDFWHPDCEKMKFCRLSLPLSGILL